MSPALVLLLAGSAHGYAHVDAFDAYVRAWASRLDIIAPRVVVAELRPEPKATRREFERVFMVRKGNGRTSDQGLFWRRNYAQVEPDFSHSDGKVRAQIRVDVHQLARKAGLDPKRAKDGPLVDEARVKLRKMALHETCHVYLDHHLAEPGTDIHDRAHGRCMKDAEATARDAIEKIQPGDGIDPPKVLEAKDDGRPWWLALLLLILI